MQTLVYGGALLDEQRPYVVQHDLRQQKGSAVISRTEPRRSIRNTLSTCDSDPVDLPFSPSTTERARPDPSSRGRGSLGEGVVENTRAVRPRRPCAAAVQAHGLRRVVVGVERQTDETQVRQQRGFAIERLLQLLHHLVRERTSPDIAATGVHERQYRDFARGETGRGSGPIVGIEHGPVRCRHDVFEAAGTGGRRHESRFRCRPPLSPAANVAAAKNRPPHNATGSKISVPPRSRRSGPRRQTRISSTSSRISCDAPGRAFPC